MTSGIFHIRPFDSVLHLDVKHEFMRYNNTSRGIGNFEILKHRKIGLFCSSKCPASLILQAHDFAKGLRDQSVTVISGFHSPVEKECLEVLLRGSLSIIVCVARSLEGMRIPQPWRKPIDQGRMLLLSCFAENEQRVCKETAQERNRFAAALSSACLIIHSEPSSHTFALAQEIIREGKPVWTFDAPANADLLNLGAKPLIPENFDVIMR
ncbi:DNA-processing protein DprA [bacterium]|nr:DNA-processing protein DprA [bacterium]